MLFPPDSAFCYLCVGAGAGTGDTVTAVVSAETPAGQSGGGGSELLCDSRLVLNLSALCKEAKQVRSLRDALTAWGGSGAWRCSG